jgi:hypothetical protein
MYANVQGKGKEGNSMCASSHMCGNTQKKGRYLFPPVAPFGASYLSSCFMRLWTSRTRLYLLCVFSKPDLTPKAINRSPVMREKGYRPHVT